MWYTRILMLLMLLLLILCVSIVFVCVVVVCYAVLKTRFVPSPDVNAYPPSV